ncbi:MAG: hypothetical protein VX527_08755 [Planctomycetota bacterium]|nr:hypothetical protein [Planctomycetota bacterium]
MRWFVTSFVTFVALLPAVAEAVTGDATGQEGAPSHFQGRVVVMTPAGPSYRTIDMKTAVDGSTSFPIALARQAMASMSPPGMEITRPS